MISRQMVLGLMLAAAVVAPPAASAATTFNVDAGQEGFAGTAATTLPLKFYPGALTIHAGDRVTWNLTTGHHTITFPKRGGGFPLQFGAPAAQKVNLVDAAGSPFWFNGLDYPQLSAEATTLSVNAKVDGTTVVNSGYPGVNAGKSFTAQFPKAGAYTYVCVLHPGMVGQVRVVPRGAKSDTVAQVAARRNRLLKADAARVNALIKRPPPARTVQIGRQTASGVSDNAFFPATLKVAAGTTVTFAVPRQTITEPHTVTFGPEGPQLAPNGGGGPIPGTDGKLFSLDGRIAYPSEPSVLASPYGYFPWSPITYDGTNHGDGLLNFGLVTGASPPVKVTFTKPGTFTYLCVFHKGMTGTVVVT